MLGFLNQKNRMSIFVGGLLVFSAAGVYAQNTDYEQRLKQTEHAVQQMVKPNIAVFDIHNNTHLKKMTLDLIRVAKDPKIHGILLWIDSSGGSVGVFSSVHDTLLRIGSIKPVVALIRGNAYSCGYLIASAAHYIFAHSQSEVGCIGVILTIKKYKNLKIAEDGLQADVDVSLFSTAKYKVASSLYGGDLTDDDKNEFARGNKALNQQFIADVARNRNLDIEKADQWADARSFIAHEAVELGLIDEVGTAFEAEAKMVELIREKNPDKLVKGDVEYIFFDCV